MKELMLRFQDNAVQPVNPAAGVWMIPGFGNTGVVETDEERELHRLKGELLGALGDKESSFIARNIFYNGHNLEMKLAGGDGH